MTNPKELVKAKDAVIEELEKKVNKLNEEKVITVKERVAEVENLKKTLDDLNRELPTLRSESKKSRNKSRLSRNILEEQLLGIIHGGSQSQKTNDLINTTMETYTSLFTEDDF